MAAALEAYDKGVKKILILERADTLGGILEQCIHTGFGLHYFGEELSGPEYAGRFIKQVKETDIDVKVDTMVLDISDDNVVTAVNNKDGLLTIKAKAVVLAMGYRNKSTLYSDLLDTMDCEVYQIGDCRQTRKIADAVREGHIIAKNL